MDGDIALVKLSRKAKLNRFVQTVCLPDENEGDLAIPKTKGIVAGWGITRALTSTQLEEVTTEDFSNVLRHSALEIRSDELCLLRSIIRYNSTMTFCAGDENGTRDSCKGDSGGAFVRHVRRGPVHRQWVAVGLVSWGYGCAQPGQYGYYTRVYHLFAGLIIVSIFFMANWKGIVYQGLLLQQNNIYLSVYVTVVTVGCLKYLQLTRVKQPITTLQM